MSMPRPEAAPLPSAQGGADRRGLLFALAAYGLWGVLPVYVKLLGFADAAEVVAYRVVCSLVMLVVLIRLSGRWHTVTVLRPAELCWLAVSGTLISANWLLFVWAVFNDRLLDASLGYFINPLMNVVLGVLLFKEWLRPMQRLALAVAVIGVANEVVTVGVFPWVGLALALSFGLYGVVRKRLAVDAAAGLTVEVALVAPLALGYLLLDYFASHGVLARGQAGEIGLLALAGPATVLPLVCFSAAAVRLPLSVLGFIQYLAPSLMFLLAVLVYGEPFRPSQLVTFGCIWLALVIFSSEALYHQRRLQRQVAAPVTGERAL